MMRTDRAAHPALWLGPVASEAAPTYFATLPPEHDRHRSLDPAGAFVSASREAFWLHRLLPSALDLRQMAEPGMSYDGIAFCFDDDCYDAVNGIAHSRQRAGGS